jgi:hypothetical protein
LVTIKQTGALLCVVRGRAVAKNCEGEYAMNDQEFFELQLRATIVPQQVRWPAPENLHWQRLHEAVNEARERMSKAYAQMDEIDRDAGLSRDDKHRQRSQAADEAIADFEASKTLMRAREDVALVVAKRKVEQHVSPQIARDSEATLKAMKEVERDWPRAMNKIAERAGRTKGPGIRR